MSAYFEPSYLPAALLPACTSSLAPTTPHVQGGNPLDLSWWEPLDLEEVALDSFCGITCFKVGRTVTRAQLEEGGGAAAAV